MYNQPQRPVVPQLKRLTWNEKPYYRGSETKYDLYLLDWKPKEKQMRKDHQNYINHCKQNKKQLHTQFEKTRIFPPEYLEWLYNLRFMLSENYVHEIAYHVKHGQEEWSRTCPDGQGGLDTAVREYTLKPAKSHFDVAFYLLADFVWDPVKQKKEFELTQLAKCVMLAYFWDDQTGNGLIPSNCGLERMVERYGENYNVTTDQQKWPESEYWGVAKGFALALAKNAYGEEANGYVDIETKIKHLELQKLRRFHKRGGILPDADLAMIA